MRDTLMANSRQPHARQETATELVARVHHLLTRSFGEHLKEHGLSPTEWRVLAALGDHDGLTMTELAALALFNQSRLTRAVDRMEQAQLVRRDTSDEDRRRVLVFLTERGRRVAAPVALCARRFDAAVDRTLGALGLRELKAALARLSDSLTGPIHADDQGYWRLGLASEPARGEADGVCRMPSPGRSSS